MAADGGVLRVESVKLASGQQERRIDCVKLDKFLSCGEMKEMVLYVCMCVFVDTLLFVYYVDNLFTQLITLSGCALRLCVYACMLFGK